MKNWLLAVAGCVGLALAGCKADPAIVMLERDNRLKEDEIYRLRGQVDDLEDELAAARACPAQPVTRVPESRTAPAPMAPAPPVVEVPQTTVPRSSPAPAASKKGSPLAIPKQFTAPIIEMPKEALPEKQLPEIFRTPEKPQPPTPAVPRGERGESGRSASEHNKSEGSSVRTATAAPAGADSSRVTRITLNKSLTGGYKKDDRPGNEGLLVVVEPRDASGQVLGAAGDLTVMVVDPALQGDAAKIARWDFTASQVANMLRTGPDGGVYLELAWPANPPAHSRLQVFARYTTTDGRKLEADRAVEVALAGEKSAGWLPMRAGPTAAAVQGSAESWQSVPQPATRVPDAPAARPASRADSTALQRPAWSPERR